MPKATNKCFVTNKKQPCYSYQNGCNRVSFKVSYNFGENQALNNSKALKNVNNSTSIEQTNLTKNITGRHIKQQRLCENYQQHFTIDDNQCSFWRINSDTASFLTDKVDNNELCEADLACWINQCLSSETQEQWIGNYCNTNCSCDHIGEEAAWNCLHSVEPTGCHTDCKNSNWYTLTCNPCDLADRKSFYLDYESHSSFHRIICKPC